MKSGQIQANSYYEVFNVQNRLLFFGKLERQNSISTSNWESGLYILITYENDNIVQHKKIIKQ